MGPLADVCKTLFEKYRPQLASLSTSEVQRYFRKGYNPRLEYFFDLRHMLEKAGASAQEMAQVDAALKACILYEAHTDYFMSLRLKDVCGMSVYMPSCGNEAQDAYYKATVDWNNATQLIK